MLMEIATPRRHVVAALIAAVAVAACGVKGPLVPAPKKSPSSPPPTMPAIPDSSSPPTAAPPPPGTEPAAPPQKP